MALQNTHEILSEIQRLLVLVAQELESDVASKMVAPKPPANRVKLAIVVGHNEKAQGADSPYLPPEYSFHKSILTYIKDAAEKRGVEVKFFERKPGVRGYKAEIDAVYDQVDEWGAHYSIELHYNAASPAATGSEVLCSRSSASYELAKAIQKAQIDAFGLRDRGIHTRLPRQGRGWYSMYAGKAPAILIEPGFGSNKKDAGSLRENWPRFADLMVKAVADL